MWEEASDVVKVAGLILAIFIPCIGAYFVFRKELIASKVPPNVGEAGLIAIAGGLTTKEGMMNYIESQQQIKETIEDLIKMNREVGTSIADGLTRQAKAMEEMVHLMKMRG